MRLRFFRGSLIALCISLMLSATPTVARGGSVKNFATVINGAQETPPNVSNALGNGILTYDTKTKILCYYVSYVGTLAGGEILAHIHGPAGPGVPAGIVLSLPLGTVKSACVVEPAAPFDAKALLKNQYYVNIHSAGLPAGEIRGQILRIK